jgi:hypothetical protein
MLFGILFARLLWYRSKQTTIVDLHTSFGDGNIIDGENGGKREGTGLADVRKYLCWLPNLLPNHFPLVGFIFFDGI